LERETILAKQREQRRRTDDATRVDAGEPLVSVHREDHAAALVTQLDVSLSEDRVAHAGQLHDVSSTLGPSRCLPLSIQVFDEQGR